MKEQFNEQTARGSWNFHQPINISACRALSLRWCFPWAFLHRQTCRRRAAPIPPSSTARPLGCAKPKLTIPFTDHEWQGRLFRRSRAYVPYGRGLLQMVVGQRAALMPATARTRCAGSASLISFDCFSKGARTFEPCSPGSGCPMGLICPMRQWDTHGTAI